MEIAHLIFARVKKGKDARKFSFICRICPFGKHEYNRKKTGHGKKERKREGEKSEKRGTKMRNRTRICCVSNDQLYPTSSLLVTGQVSNFDHTQEP